MTRLIAEGGERLEQLCWRIVVLDALEHERQQADLAALGGSLHISMIIDQLVGSLLEEEASDHDIFAAEAIERLQLKGLEHLSPQQGLSL